MDNWILYVKIVAIFIGFIVAIIKEVKELSNLKEGDLTFLKLLPILLLVIGFGTALTIEISQDQNNQKKEKDRADTLASIISKSDTSINKLNNLDSISNLLKDSVKSQLVFQKENNKVSDEILEKNIQMYQDKQEENKSQINNYDKRLYSTYLIITANYPNVEYRYNFRGIDSVLRFERLAQIVSTTITLLNSEFENPVLFNSSLFYPYWDKFRNELLKIEIEMGMTQTSYDNELQSFQSRIGVAFREFGNQGIFLRNKSFLHPNKP